jgi:magnesium transporter
MTWKIGVVAGLATMGSMSIACLVGSAIPLILDRLGFDPATASSIFLTMLTDSLGYAVFLTLAFLTRGWLGVG